MITLSAGNAAVLNMQAPYQVSPAEIGLRLVLVLSISTLAALMLAQRASGPTVHEVLTYE